MKFSNAILIHCVFLVLCRLLSLPLDVNCANEENNNKNGDSKRCFYQSYIIHTHHTHEQ